MPVPLTAPHKKKSWIFYIRDQWVLPEDLEATDFWVQNRKKYPSLVRVALDLLVIPVSSTPIERIFSTAGMTTTGRRNRLRPKNLEREILIRNFF